MYVDVSHAWLVGSHNYNSSYTDKEEMLGAHFNEAQTDKIHAAIWQLCLIIGFIIK
jgi:hypothetical protein